MNILQLKMVVAASERAVEFVPGEGAHCPVCEEFNLGRHRGMVLTTQGMIRYCRCGNCGITFKAIGDTAKKVDAVTSTENLDNKQSAAHYKSRKRRKK